MATQVRTRVNNVDAKDVALNSTLLAAARHLCDSKIPIAYQGNDTDGNKVDAKTLVEKLRGVTVQVTFHDNSVVSLQFLAP
eukprot:EW704755.1.p1 GENE.EW704755.1~~EW704755.1.p1  ORF type:complete len:81 (+),score=5.95 EW704755.1:39-281(+)